MEENENTEETWRNIKVAQTSRTMRGKTIIELTLHGKIIDKGNYRHMQLDIRILADSGNTACIENSDQ